MMENTLQQKRNQDRSQLEAHDENHESEGKSMSPPAFAVTASGGNAGNPTDNLKSEMGESMGADFSSVQFKLNSSKASELEAKAFAQGNEVHFAPGQFNPHSTEGKSLVGHELAHVVQQRQGRVQPTTQLGGEMVNDHPGLEAEADQWGAKAARGESVGQRKTAGGSNNSHGPVQRMGHAKLSKEQQETADKVLKSFHQALENEASKSNKNSTTPTPQTFTEGKTTFKFEKSTSQNTRSGNLDSMIYLGDDGLRYTFVRKGNDKFSVGGISQGNDKNANLKASRPDNLDYCWKGKTEVGIKYGMNPEYQLKDHETIPQGFVPTHLTHLNGIQYFKKTKSGKGRNAAPKHSDLMDRGYGIRRQEKKHHSGKEDHGSANSVMGASATQYAGSLSKLLAESSNLSPDLVPNNTNYEWCHLIGHGDGGEEVPENYVAGTHYANTEQLAIETAIRKFRGVGLILKVHSYQKPVREGITVDSYYGDYVRYTVEYNGIDIFSHLFSLHSDSFDKREWNVLQVNCQNAIMLALENKNNLNDTEKLKIGNKHKNGLTKVQDESKEKPTGNLGKSNKLYESDTWNELSTQAYEASSKIRQEVEQVIKDEMATRLNRIPLQGMNSIFDFMPEPLPFGSDWGDFTLGERNSEQPTAKKRKDEKQPLDPMDEPQPILNSPNSPIFGDEFTFGNQPNYFPGDNLLSQNSLDLNWGDQYSEFYIDSIQSDDEKIDLNKN